MFGNSIINSTELSNLDLVIIWLGENFDVSVEYEDKMTNLIQYIKEASPNCEILWICGWNMNENVLNKIPAICERQEIQFLNIFDLYKEEYQALVNAEEGIYYPNNEAMQIISNRIIEILKFDF